MSTYYHVTDVKNLDSILKDGLIPRVGPLAEQYGVTGEPVPAIYLFTSDTACIQAMYGWLGDAFDELDEKNGEMSRHVVLRVELNDTDEEDYEFDEKIVYKPIPADQISVCFNIMCDFDYDEAWFSNRYEDSIR